MDTSGSSDKVESAAEIYRRNFFKVFMHEPPFDVPEGIETDDTSFFIPECKKIGKKLAREGMFAKFCREKTTPFFYSEFRESIKAGEFIHLITLDNRRFYFRDHYFIVPEYRTLAARQWDEGELPAICYRRLESALEEAKKIEELRCYVLIHGRKYLNGELVSWESLPLHYRRSPFMEP